MKPKSLLPHCHIQLSLDRRLQLTPFASTTVPSMLDTNQSKMPAETRCSPHPPTLGTRKRVMNQEVKQAKAKRSVSAASIFKPRQVEKTWRASPAKLIAVSTGTGFSSPSVEQIYDPKSLSNTHAPAKTGVGGQKRGAENHPLAIAFKGILSP